MIKNTPWCWTRSVDCKAIMLDCLGIGRLGRSLWYLEYFTCCWILCVSQWLQCFTQVQVASVSHCNTFRVESTPTCWIMFFFLYQNYFKNWTTRTRPTVRPDLRLTWLDQQQLIRSQVVCKHNFFRENCLLAAMLIRCLSSLNSDHPWWRLVSLVNAKLVNPDLIGSLEKVDQRHHHR